MAMRGLPTSVRKKIDLGIRKGMEALSDKALIKVDEHIFKDVYGKYSPTAYIRTHDLANSIKEEIKFGKDVYTVKIYHEAKMIKPRPPDQHVSVKTGRSSAKQIPRIVHDGLAPNIFNNKSYPWMSARPYMDNARASMIKGDYHKKIVTAELEKRGVKCSW